MKRILVESDYHCGHVLGLTPPDWQTKQSKKFAGPVWDWREALLGEIGHIDLHVLNGDLTDGPGRKETIGLFTTDVEEQAEIAAECARRVRAKKRILTYGTPFHTVSTLSHESLVAKELGAEIYETLRLEAGGVKFNFRHVVGRSDIPYGQPGPVKKEWVNEQLHALLEGYDAAQVIVRSHVHYYERVENAHGNAFTTPAWELPNPDKDGNIFARKLRTLYYDMGAVLIEVSNGEATIRKQLMPLKIAIKRDYLKFE